MIIDHPMQLSAMLERRFGVLTGRARELALELLVPAVASNDPVAIQTALNRIEALLLSLGSQEVRAAAEDVAGRVNSRNRKLFMAGLAAAVGMKVLGDDRGGGSIPTVPLPGVAGTGRRRRGVLIAKLSTQPELLAHQFASNNASLIKSLTNEVVPALRDEVVRAVTFGITPEEAAARLEDKWRRSGVPVRRGNLEPRVRMIVQDQVAKLNTDLTKARSLSAGITKFNWVSRRDGRVRPLHRELDDGREIDFATGHPTEGLPGQPVNCRCVAVPVVNTEEVMRAPGFINLSEAEELFEIAS